MKALAYTIALMLAVLGTTLLTGCDNSCDTEGAKQCSGTMLETCIDGEWDGEDCFADVCEPGGWSSGSCSTADNGEKYCECGN